MSAILVRVGWVAWGVLLVPAISAGQEPEGGPGRARDEAAGRKGLAVFASVEDRRAVLFAVSEGTRVNKGDLICELDASGLREKLTHQDLIVARAEAELRSARLACEAAEAAVTEYLDGVYKTALESARVEVIMARADMKRAEERLAWSDRVHKKGYISKAQNTADRSDHQQKVHALDQAQARLEVLEKHTRDRTVKELRSEVENKKAIELGARAAHAQQQATRERLARQVGSCKILAPIAGRIRSAGPIEAGAIVHEGQLLYRIVPNPLYAQFSP
jgi:HlyD family secretion protein